MSDCFNCLHLLTAEQKDNVMVVYCDLRTDCICCFVKNKADEGKVIVFGKKE